MASLSEVSVPSASSAETFWPAVPVNVQVPRWPGSVIRSGTCGPSIAAVAVTSAPSVFTLSLYGPNTSFHGHTRSR